MDTLRIRDDADVEGELDDEDLGRETIWCERCGCVTDSRSLF